MAKLTVENICKHLMDKYKECPMCGGEAEICAYIKDGQQVVKIFCDGCGTSASFVEMLIELEGEGNNARFNSGQGN